MTTLRFRPICLFALATFACGGDDLSAPVQAPPVSFGDDDEDGQAPDDEGEPLDPAVPTTTDGCVRIRPAATLTPDGSSVFVARNELGLGEPDRDDEFRVQLRPAEDSEFETGTFELTSTANRSPASCQQCVSVVQDSTAASGALFFQSDGQISVSVAQADELSVTLTGVQLVETALDATGSPSSAVVGGRCLRIEDGTYSTEGQNPGSVDESGCNRNGEVDGDEVCDGNDLGAATCSSMGYFEGTLFCNDSCTLNTSGCAFHPNGYRQNFEGSTALPNEFGLSGDGGWSVVEGFAFEGSRSLRSDPIDAGQTASAGIALTFEEAGSIHFAVAIMGGPQDQIRFYIDGEFEHAYLGVSGWNEESYPIAAGFHWFDWEYVRSDDSAVGEDAAWIDDIQTMGGLLDE